MISKGMKIAPPQGKLGVVLPGMGAISSTLIAGIEAVKRGVAKPIGSLTQMGTIRLGKRTENRTPAIKDFVPLASLDDLVFGGWDIFSDNIYEAGVKAKVLERSLLDQVRPALEERPRVHGDCRLSGGPAGIPRGAAAGAGGRRAFHRGARAARDRH